MEETVRALVGADPDVYWTVREDPPAAPPATGPESESPIGQHMLQHILIDVTHPIQARIYLPGCAGANNVRTVEHAANEAGPVERETVAQIVKAALQGLRGEPAAAASACGGAKEREREKVVLVGNPQRRPAGAIWVGLGGGAAWGYVPSGNLEWEARTKVAAQAEWAGLLHLLPEVGYMVSDDFALAVQARVEFIRQSQATVRDPDTGQVFELGSNVAGEPHGKAYAGFLRAIWYRDMARGGRLRLSLSGDLGGGYVRFAIPPVGVAYRDVNGDTQIDWSKSIARTDTRPVGVLLFGGSVGLLWHLTRNLALALDGRALSGLPDWGFVLEAQASVQVAFGGASGRVVTPEP
jgi:hypothetical protein